MAPIPFQRPVRYAPLALAGTHLSLIVYLTYAVGASLYTSYKSLGPAQDTRSRTAQRKRVAPAFAALALAALSLATYTSIASAKLSYKTWAYENGLDLHSQPDDALYYSEQERDPTPFYVTQWLSETPLYLDTLEIVAEKARRFWWGQQIDLATMAFSALLATEGRRRKIPMLSAFLALAHLVNLSFAQNLFFLALLLTPLPLPAGDADLELPVVPLPTTTWTRIRNKLMTPKPKNWYLHPPFIYTPLAVNFASIFLLPYTATISSFSTIVFLSRVTSFLPLLLPKIVPVSWGRIYQGPHDTYPYSFTRLFRVVSIASFALHAKATLVALVSNAPNSHFHRHSELLPWDIQERSKWEQSTSAIGKVLGSTSDHPAVAAVGWDVLICTLSLGVWVAIRATNVQALIKCAVPFTDVSDATTGSKSHKGTSEDVAVKDEPEQEIAEHQPQHEHEHGMTLRRRGRPSTLRARVGSIASSSGASEDVVMTPPTPRKRGRPRKSKQTEEEEKPYTPEPGSSEARQVVEGDVIPADVPDWEAASLAWGIAVFGGLASACAGVFGGECISR